MSFKVEYVNKLKVFFTVCVIVLLFVFAQFLKGAFAVVEDKLVDLRSRLTLDGGLFSQRYKSADSNIVIVSINDLTQYEAANSPELNLRKWPWSREVWAKVINFLEKQNPKVLVVDLNFSNYEDLSRNYASADMRLADTLGYYKNIVLATALRTQVGDDEKYDASKILDNFENPYSPSSDALSMHIYDENLDSNITYYSHTPIPDIFTNSTTMAVTNLVTDKNNKDENVRYSQPVYRLIKGNKEFYIPSLALATMMKYNGIDPLTEEIVIKDNVLRTAKNSIRLDSKGRALINWHKDVNAYTDIPINAVLLSMVRGVNYFEYDNKKIPLDFFKDKIVIIAQTQSATETHNTPVAKDMPDAQIKATIIDNYINDANTQTDLRKNFVKHLNPVKGAIITAAFCMAIIIAMLVATNLPLAFINGVLLICTYVLFGVFVFAYPHLRLLIDMAEPLYWIIAIFMLAFGLKAHYELKRKRKIERIFGNLVSEKVLKQLVNKPHRLNLKSTVQKVTVMSCNIYNDIQISKALPPEKYVELINKIFNSIEKIIFKYNGTINRFVGNSVQVYWGYPIHSRKDSENALRAAIEIQQKIDEINTSVSNINFEEYDEQTFDGRNKYSVDVKIAINTGDALVGQIGSSNMSDFTVMGETVDIVERIKDICLEFNKDIIVTENTLNNIDEKIPAEYIGSIRVKNSSDKVKIFEIRL